jgi:hypothetical protein
MKHFNVFGAPCFLHETITINPLKPMPVFILFKEIVRTSKKTPHFTITKMKWLKLFKEVIAFYYEKYKKPINTKCRVTDY